MTVYGIKRENDVLLRPLKHLSYMVPVPCALFTDEKSAVEAAEKYGYKIEWISPQELGT